MKLIAMIIVVAPICCWSAAARASQYQAENTWRAAVSNAYLIDTFESYSVGTQFGGLSSLGVTLPPLTGGVQCNVESALSGTTSFHTGLNALMNGPAFPGAGAITVVPTTTAFEAMGFWVTRPVTGTTVLSFFRADNTLIDSVVHAPSGSPSFIGLVAGEPVAYATISMPSGDGWIALDDLQVSTVPAPGAAAGVALGLGGLIAKGRRRCVHAGG